MKTNGPRSVTYIVRRELSLPHRPQLRAHARSQTASLVVLAGLAVMITAVISIILHLVAWEVLT